MVRRVNRNTGIMESFFSTLKQEELYRSSYRSENEFKKRVSEYMKFYNKLNTLGQSYHQVQQ
ncbi:IS3 family transposase [Subdoligranulum sp. DSM 109015]|uniref:IS3 family transposase n=2 Tax=Gemmiger gallinarum TaxID=2779354 RepID=A0ABR9R1S7_9FIRM|nr:IS3 family transposase [Gemmiger gallinarum]